MFPGNQGDVVKINKYYEVLDIVLGRGSFSTVYLARHLTFGNQVAFKVIDRKDIKEEYVRKNLHREARILRKLNHPNIVNFYEEISEKDLYCLSMEYIKGEDLSEYLKKQDYSKVSERVAKTLFYQMVSAVDHLHYNNVLHRDLKQENILLEQGKVIKIVDFGLSNIYTPRVRLRTHCGSMVYAAPELFLNRSVYGAGVDLWSLGVILYSMVIGRMPFELDRHIKGSNNSPHKKDLFYKRISQGLTEDNYTDMQMLSLDCCNLLKNLLQPDQFKRIQIQAARLHPWFHKDTDLMKRLPNPRNGLRERFTPEIIDFMADKMHVSRQRVQNHIRTYKFETISAIFNILRDTLIKEILYPPKALKSSLLLRFEKWKKGLETDESDDSTIGDGYTIQNSADFTSHSQLAAHKKEFKYDLNSKNLYQNIINYTRDSQPKDVPKRILIAKKQIVNDNTNKSKVYNNLRKNSNMNTTKSAASHQSFDSAYSVHNLNRFTNPLQMNDNMKRSIAQRPFEENLIRKTNNLATQSSYRKTNMEAKVPPILHDRGEMLPYFNNNIGYAGIHQMKARAGDGINNYKSNFDMSTTKQGTPEENSQSKIPVRAKQPVKSYKNSRPCNVDVSTKQILNKIKQSPASTHTQDKTDYISKMPLNPSNTSAKIVVLRKNPHNLGDGNSFKSRSKHENENGSIIPNYSSSNRKRLEKSPSLITQSTTSAARQIKKADKATTVSDSFNRIPKQCETYLQRDILISRADRGNGRIFFNSNILPRSFKNNISSTSGQNPSLENYDYDERLFKK